MIKTLTSIRWRSSRQERDYGGLDREDLQYGFLHPSSLKKLGAAKKSKGKMKNKPIELLDDGYFGHGIYFTKYSDYA